MIREIYIKIYNTNNLKDFVYNYLWKYDISYRIYSELPIDVDEKQSSKASPIALSSLVFGVIGCISALYMQYWTNTIDYPLNLSGKPFWGIIHSVPVVFICTILFAAIGGFIAFVIINRQSKNTNDIRILSNYDSVVDYPLVYFKLTDDRIYNDMEEFMLKSDIKAEVRIVESNND